MSLNVFETLQIDEDKSRLPLSHREKIGVTLLWVIFTLVYPAKYSHEMKALWSELRGVLNK